MNLKDIFNEILNIARDIENNNLSYPLAPLVNTKRKANPADPLTAVATRFTLDITNNITPSKHKIESALKDLKKIAKDYQIEQLRRPIKELSAFLDDLG